MKASNNYKLVSRLVFLCVAKTLNCIIIQQSNRDLAVIALVKLIETSGSGSQIFTAIRCLLRIKLTIMDANPENKL